MSVFKVPLTNTFLRTKVLALSALAIISTLLLTHLTQAAGVLAVDKVITKNQSTAATSVTTASFSTVETNELLVAFIAADGPNIVNGQSVTAISTTGATLNWTLRQRANTQFGTSEIWQAKAPSVLSNVTVKATLKSSAMSSLNVVAFTGADLSVNGSVGAANASTGAPSVSLTATRNGSWVWGVGNDWDKKLARTVGPNQDKVAEFLPSVGDTFWLQRLSLANSTAGGVTTLNDTAPTTDRWNFAAIEILPAVTDTTPPSAPTNLTATASSPTSVGLSWTAASDNVGVTGYRIYRGGTLLTTVGAVVTYMDGTTSANTNYSYTVRAIDAAGNESTDSNTSSVTTPAPDITAPTITGVAANSITQNSATLSWITDEASDTQVEYGTTTGYGTLSTYNAALVTNHSVGITGLASSQLYHYRVISKDASGNTSRSTDATFTTLAPAGDTTPPSTSVTSPSNGGTVSGTVSVTASATDNVGVAGVQFKLDGTNLGSEDTTSPYAATWNTSTATNGNHQLQAIARDAAGNTTTSATVTVTVSNGTGGGTPLTINGLTTYQTMTGLGASINSDSWDNGALKPVIDKLIDQNGTKTFRVVIEMMDWEAVNDDADPATFNWSYYDPIYSGAVDYDTAQAGSNFGNLWNTIDYLHARGIPDGQIILSFMGPGPSWLSGSTTQMDASKEDEFVETVLSAAYYGYSHGHTFGVFSPDNEADLTPNQEGIVMSSSVYASSMNKLANRMDSLGMSAVRILGPETGSTNASFVNAMKVYPALMAKLDHFDFHNYGGTTNGATGVISGTGKDFWMSEFSIFSQAFSLLNENASGLMMWDAYDSVYNHAILNGLGSAPGNDSGNDDAWFAYNATTKVYTARKNFYQYAQLFKHVPLGSVRIGATQSNGNVSVVAFYHPVTKQVTVVGYNQGSSSITYNGTLNNLQVPPSFEYYVTDSSRNIQRGSDVVVNGNTFTAVAPANGVFTLTYAPPADQEPPTAPTNLQASGSVGAASLSWQAASDAVGVSAYNVYRSTTAGFTPSAGNKIGQTNGLNYTDTSAPAGTYYYQITAQDVVGNVGPASNEANAIITEDTTAPTAPSNLQLTGVSGNAVSVNWTASTDDVAVTGYRVYRNGTLLNTVSSLAFTDNTVQQNTTYSYVVVAVDGVGNQSVQSAPLQVTTPTQALAVDAQVIAHKTAVSGNTIVSPAITTTKAKDLLVTYISSSGPTGGGKQTISSVTTPGLTWTLAKRVNGVSGDTEIWTAVAPNIINSATVTATQSVGGYVGSIVVTAFSGASTTVGATAGVFAASGAPTVNLIATKAGSWLWGSASTWDAAAAITVANDQTKVDEYQSSVGDTMWVQRRNAFSTAVGQTMTLNDTAPTNLSWNFAAIEVLPL